MSSRLAYEWITDLDDEVPRSGSFFEKTLNKLPLSCRYPETDLGETPSNFSDSSEMLDGLNVTTIMPPKIRTLSTVVLNDDHHRIHPVRISNSSQPFLQGLTDIWTCVIAFECVTLFTDASFYLAEFTPRDTCLCRCARTEPRHLRCVAKTASYQ